MTVLAAVTPEEIVPVEYIEELLRDRDVSVIHEEDDFSLSLVPQCKYREKIISDRIEKTSSPYTAEFLYLVSKKEVLESGKKNMKDISMEDISEIFTALSNMSGMRYRFSDSNPDGTVLYKKVCTVESDEKRKEIADAVSRNCNGMNLYCHQHDRLLGNLYFLLKYEMQEDELYLSITNMNNLGLLGFNACKKENLRINIHVTDCGEDILFYISADANYENVLKMFSIRKVIKKLMNERLDAIYRWFFFQF
ncbi:MAG: hypothetical protein MJZ80_09820 [Treponema sp.]|nr:hypothetical protein [Treponema sp.]